MASLPPSYHLFRPICAVCSKPSGGLVLSKGCDRGDHADADGEQHEGDLHCDEETLWPCSQECAEQLVRARHAILVLETVL